MPNSSPLLAIITRHARAKLVVLGLITLVALPALWLYLTFDPELRSPLTSIPLFHFLSTQRSSKNKVVYGYLPYWNLSKVTLQPELTHLSYFSLGIGPDGKLLTRTSEGGEPGYTKLQSETWLDVAAQAKAQNTAIELTLTQFNSDDIATFISSPTAHQQLLNSLDSVLLAYPVSGINIDIEYVGESNDALRRRFVEFMTRLRTHLNTRYSGVRLSVAMYAGAASSPQIWDVGKIAEQCDYIVIMAYDFHRRSSPQAGPVAPLLGGKEMWDSDINHHLQSFLEVAPAHKLLLGVPFYGYEWQTTSRDAQAHTFPDTGSTATYTRVQELLKKKDELKVKEEWNEAALSPYVTYVEKGETFVIYYENTRSLSYKLDYVNQLDLGGIAIWALGYEDDSRELWDVIARKL